MTDAEQILESQCDDPVVLWRFDELVRACGDFVAAWLLALDGRVDLHRAVDLLRAGCPPQTALRILL